MVILQVWPHQHHVGTCHKCKIISPETTLRIINSGGEAQQSVLFSKPFKWFSSPPGDSRASTFLGLLSKGKRRLGTIVSFYYHLLYLEISNSFTEIEK